MKTLKLVGFQKPIFSTVQGEGHLSGTPSVFVRLHGCDFSCEWCDTKESWREGSDYDNTDVDEVIELIKLSGMEHVVITGGNPILQGDSLLDVVQELKEHHITIETQASVYHDIARDADLLSLSPKLHDWREDVIQEFLDNAQRETQFKVVVPSMGDLPSALRKLERVNEMNPYKTVHYFIQPEYNGGRALVRSIIDSIIESRFLGSINLPNLRVLPQLHKTSLHVV